MGLEVFGLKMMRSRREGRDRGDTGDTYIFSPSRYTRLGYWQHRGSSATSLSLRRQQLRAAGSCVLWYRGILTSIDPCGHIDARRQHLMQGHILHDRKEAELFSPPCGIDVVTWPRPGERQGKAWCTLWLCGIGGGPLLPGNVRVASRPQGDIHDTHVWRRRCPRSSLTSLSRRRNETL